MFLSLTLTTSKPILLILDGHTSHRRVRTIELAISNGSVWLCILPHSTYIFQPRDITFFKSIKHKYHEILAEYILLLKLFQSTAINKVNIIKGFIATAIYPLDKSAIKNNRLHLRVNQKGLANLAHT
ncbi:unnamed protein product [Didymodactylos carnosus]|uniref:DDE-1 domain-containing protein n=1 Tax=Didymodactylos carnosus TaxID=1234261 RepID=A0A813UC94_9BILA|nr:unnamed protein product [Didymodactylos carnosus]CAF1015833.1 unnamed protein product [Didymodactylos carnosus]CAF3611386.1 unnamed protein product [Didymodactylos carnosus]CAF3784940.1 unnamed protein product [Didymodactylos carnosus]